MSAPSTDKAAVKAIIRALRAEGWHLSTVYDGEDEFAVTTADDAITHIFDVDEAHLNVKFFTGPAEQTGWVWFVLGNEPFEVAADYTVNLSEALDPLFETWDEE